MLKPTNLQDSLQEQNKSYKATVNNKLKETGKTDDLLDNWQLIQDMMKTEGWKLLEAEISKELIRVNGQLLNGNKDMFDNLQGKYSGVGFVMSYIKGLQNKTNKLNIK